MGHIKMMAATQPFLSGAISKTVNLPQDCSVDDIAEAYIESWRQGLKAVAIYRDNSKGTQPLNVSGSRRQGPEGRKTVAVSAAAVHPAAKSEGSAVLAPPKPPPAQASRSPPSKTQLHAIADAASQNADAADAQSPPRAVRHRLPAERASITHKFGLAGHEGYITVGLYPNGQPGEIFIRMAKEGSTVSGLMDSFATAVSLALQHGVPLRVLCEKFAHTRFEPSGWTGNEQIGYAKSIMDYIFRWIQIRFLSGHQLYLFAGLAVGAASRRTRPRTPSRSKAPSRAPEATSSPRSRPRRSRLRLSPLPRLCCHPAAQRRDPLLNRTPMPRPTSTPPPRPRRESPPTLRCLP